MGQLQRDAEDKKKSTRGSVNNSARLSKLAAAKHTTTADWGGCDARWMQALITLISKHKGAIRFGLSRDGGSYSVGLYLGEETQTLWYNGDVDLDTVLGELYEELRVILGE